MNNKPLADDHIYWNIPLTIEDYNEDGSAFKITEFRSVTILEKSLVIDAKYVIILEP